MSAGLSLLSGPACCIGRLVLCGFPDWVASRIQLYDVVYKFEKTAGKEKQTLNDCIIKIENELSQNIDRHSQNLIVSNIELLLNYCIRYYDRQFITRKNTNKDTLMKFENILANYFNSDKLKSNGLPTVKYCAEQLFLSPNYLSDLLKKETGKNARVQIHYYLIEAAKNNLFNTNATVSEIAYNLGFEYPQYFSKLFKSKTGTTQLNIEA